METTVHLERRSESGKGAARKLRRAGRVPGVIYGGDQDPVLVSGDAQTMLRLFQSISVENTVLGLYLDGKRAGRGLVRELQAHPFRPELLHMDFLRLQRGVAVEVSVPVILKGVPPGVKQGGGILDQLEHDLPVRCTPSQIPEAIHADVSEMEIGDTLRAADVDFPDEVESLSDPQQAVCSVLAPRLQEEDEDEAEEEVGDLLAEPTAE